MPRRTKVNYFPSRGGYYCQINRKQYLLASGPDDAPGGPTYEAALVAYKHLLEDSWAEQAGDGNTVRTVLELYLQQTEPQVESSTQARRLGLLRPFRDALGEVKVRELTSFKIDAFIADMRRPRQAKATVRGKEVTRRVVWNDSSVTSFLQTASAAFAWAVEKKLITENPIKGIYRPGIRSRGQDCIVSPEQHVFFLSICRSEGMRQIMVALENTGARPGELLAAEAKYWDADKQALVYLANARRKKGSFRHKAAKHKDRIIYFNGEALEMMQQLMRRHPKGPLFRRRDGTPYTLKTVQRYFHRFRTRPGVEMPELTAYSYRHTFATRWLLAGRSIEILAELLGNTPQVIRKHYAHLCGDWRAIRQQLEDFKGNTSTSFPRVAEIEPPEEPSAEVG